MRNVRAKIALFTFIITSFFFILLFVWVRPDEISSRFDKERFWVQKTHSSAIYNMVFIGDSRTYHGIVPEKIEHIFSDSIKVLNFGYSSAGLNSILINTAVSKLDSNLYPKMVIFGITLFSLTKETSTNDHFMQENNRTFFDRINRLYANEYLKIFEPTNFTTILNKIRGNKNGYYESFEKGGWVSSRKIPSDTNEAYSIYEKRLSNTIIEKSMIDTIMYFTNKLNKKGIKVYGFRPPTTSSLRNLEDSLMRFNEKEFIDKFNKAGGKWITIPNSITFYAYDGSHLDDTSAIKLSRFIGVRLYELSNFNQYLKK
jgi:hypothetical protein